MSRVRGGAPLTEIDAAVAGLRREILPSLLRRFERVASKYRRPLAPVRGGTCYGCFTRFPTGRPESAAGPDGIPACPNCGRLVYWI
jgi:predicted  nucleic acid-binding Zn-ribbon protein